MLKRPKYNFSTRVYPVRDSTPAHTEPFSANTATKPVQTNQVHAIETDHFNLTSPKKRAFASPSKLQRKFLTYRAPNAVVTADSSTRELRLPADKLPEPISIEENQTAGFESYPSLKDAWDEVPTATKIRQVGCPLEQYEMKPNSPDVADDPVSRRADSGVGRVSKSGTLSRAMSGKDQSLARQITGDKVDLEEWSKVLIIPLLKKNKPHRLKIVSQLEESMIPDILGSSSLGFLQNESQSPVNQSFEEQSVPYAESRAHLYLETENNWLNRHQTMFAWFKFVLQASILFVYLMIPLK